MKTNHGGTGSFNFHKKITGIFIFMVLCMTAVVTLYWHFVLDPQLALKADTTARSVVRANISQIAEILENINTLNRDGQIDKINTILGNTLLLKDSESGAAYITGIEICVITDTNSLKDLLPAAGFGKPLKKSPDVNELPLFALQSKELLAIIRYETGEPYIRLYLNRIKLSFYGLSGISLFILLSAWLLVAFLMKKVKKTEVELLEKQAQVIHAGRLTAMGEMATGIAHELNQPLAIIKLAADGLNNYFNDHSGDAIMEKHASEKISSQVDRAATIINNMRSFARTGNNRLEYANIKEPVLKALSFFREQFRVHEINILENIPDDELNVMLNPQRFEQVVVNLLTNARYALEQKEQILEKKYDKKITVNLTRKSENNRSSIIFEIRDNGIGMTSSEKARCLEPFFTTRKVGDGTGLGLSIVHTILREHNMEINIDSTREVGSCFIITIAG